MGREAEPSVGALPEFAPGWLKRQHREQLDALLAEIDYTALDEAFAPAQSGSTRFSTEPARCSPRRRREGRSRSSSTRPDP